MKNLSTDVDKQNATRNSTCQSPHPLVRGNQCVRLENGSRTRVAFSFPRKFPVKLCLTKGCGDWRVEFHVKTCCILLIKTSKHFLTNRGHIEGARGSKIGSDFRNSARKVAPRPFNLNSNYPWNSN